MKSGPKPRSLADRFWEKVAKAGPEECWEWTGGKYSNGYGTFSVGSRPARSRTAHRVAYELTIGPIRDGLPLDHLCRNRACVNPSHLEPVTHQENVQRGLQGRMVTHCPQGHPYDEENTSWWHARRRCRACARDRQRRLLSTPEGRRIHADREQRRRDRAKAGPRSYVEYQMDEL